MPRRGSVKERKIEVDPLYNNRLVSKLINRLMHDGKKSVVQKEVYAAFDIIKGKGEDPIKVFSKALDNIKPSVEVRPKRVGGAAYQVPMPVKGARKESLAIRWLVLFSRARPNSEFHRFCEKLAAEPWDAAEGIGGAVKKRQEVEKIAEANRAFAHFRW